MASLGGYSILRLGSAGVNWREAASTICGVLAASGKIERTKKRLKGTVYVNLIIGFTGFMDQET